MNLYYIKDFCEYLLQRKTIWNNRKDEILDLFQRYDDPIIVENFQNWFEGINKI